MRSTRTLFATFTVTIALAAAVANAGDAPATTPPATTPPATPPPADATTPPAPPADPLAEPKDLVENQSNTKANLGKAIELYEKALPAADAKAKCSGYADESRAYLRIGDLETKDDTKIANYQKGRDAAAKGVAADANCAEAIFWYNANQACIGRTKGVMNSLFMIGDLRKGLNRVLKLKPGHKHAQRTLAKIDHAVPGIAGGSDDRAEKTLLAIMAKDSHWTAGMITLAEFYKDKGKKDEAKKWAEKCVAETAPSEPADYRKFDKKDCAQVIKDVQ